ncbi:MAG: GNAT family acetyltransferase, partial [Planctomycetaceae bacterium]
IRPFAERDNEDVTGLWREVFGRQEPWNEPGEIIRRKSAQRDELFFVTELEGRIVGTLVAGYDGIRGWGYTLAVAPEHRRRGIAKQLIAQAERLLRAKGCPKINLQIRGDQPHLVALYQSCGFAVEDRVSMGKPLGRSPNESDAIPLAPVPRIDVRDGFSLTQIEATDKPAYLKYLNETDQFHRYMGFMPYPYTEADADSWISRALTETLEGRNAVTVHTSGIGSCELVFQNAADFVTSWV